MASDVRHDFIQRDGVTAGVTPHAFAAGLLGIKLQFAYMDSGYVPVWDSADRRAILVDNPRRILENIRL